MKAKSKYTVELSHYDYTANEVVQDGDVSVHTLAKSIEVEQFAELLDNYCNSFHSRFERGVKTGEILRETHRTLQRSIIVELLGVVAGLSKQDFTDARNERAIALAKKVAELVDEHGFGAFI